MKKWTASDGYLTVANILGCVAIVMLAASIGTDRWLLFTVNRAKLNVGTKNASESLPLALYHHTRQRGMFRECYPGTDNKFLDSDTNNNQRVDKNCYLVKLIDNIADASEKYKMKIGLHTGFIAMFLFGELLLIVAYILGLFLCVGKCSKNAWFAALLSFLAAFLFAFGMALFHGSFYIEQEQTVDVPFERQEYKQRWSSDLKMATTVEYKESYIVAWVGIVLVLITCICYIFAARSLKPKKREAKYPKGLDNYAYSVPHQQVMYAPEHQQPVVYYMT